MMIEISMVRDLVAIFGVIAGFSYYVLVVRNAQRTREMSLEAQKTQIFLQIYGTITPELVNHVIEINARAQPLYTPMFK